MEPIGLVAGSGRFPVLFAQAAAAAGRSVVAAAHEGETDPELERHVGRFTWVKLGQLGRIAEVLVQGGCREAVFCGGLRSFGDDASLRAIADALERQGVRVTSPLPLVPDLLAPRGPLGRRCLTGEQRSDAEVGFAVARSLGALDVGQTVVVKRGVVLAVEALEGTDACIARGLDSNLRRGQVDRAKLRGLGRTRMRHTDEMNKRVGAFDCFRVRAVL